MLCVGWAVCIGEHACLFICVGSTARFGLTQAVLPQVAHAILDSHQLELNPGKVAWSRFWDLFVVPVLRALGLMRYENEKHA